MSACPQIPLMGDLIRLPTNFPRETFSEYPCYCHTNAQYGWSYGEKFWKMEYSRLLDNASPSEADSVSYISFGRTFL